MLKFNQLNRIVDNTGSSFITTHDFGFSVDEINHIYDGCSKKMISHLKI